MTQSTLDYRLSLMSDEDLRSHAQELGFIYDRLLSMQHMVNECRKDTDDEAVVSFPIGKFEKHPLFDMRYGMYVGYARFSAEKPVFAETEDFSFVAKKLHFEKKRPLHNPFADFYTYMQTYVSQAFKTGVYDSPYVPSEVSDVLSRDLSEDSVLFLENFCFNLFRRSCALR